MVEAVGKLDFAFGPRNLSVKPRAIVGKPRSRVHGTDGAMDVQIVSVTMNDGHTPMMAQAEFIKDLPDVCMCLFIG
ncbi:MAG TPA: hypothetical protein VMW12_07445 [Candidatus Dormibacteraeota bacterium]|nr:hypothetical protein [Candidatus Dormibacteraeota bacterium]